jgi:hypothetical protein
VKTIEAVNLWGEPITLQVSTARRPTNRRGYAAQPGTGPAGETCKTCRHACRTNEQGSKQYWKCGLRRSDWTGGYGTDILARSPACSKWEAA